MRARVSGCTPTSLATENEGRYSTESFLSSMTLSISGSGNGVTLTSTRCCSTSTEMTCKIETGFITHTAYFFITHPYTYTHTTLTHEKKSRSSKPQAPFILLHVHCCRERHNWTSQYPPDGNVLSQDDRSKKNMHTPNSQTQKCCQR